MIHTCKQINTANKWEQLGHGEHMGRKTQTVQNPDILSPSRKARPRGNETTEGVRAWGEAQEEDGHLGGGRQIETREVTMDGGAKEETGGTWS